MFTKTSLTPEAQLKSVCFAIVPNGVAETALVNLDKLRIENGAGLRNLLQQDAVRRLAISAEIRGLVSLILGPSCFAVRAILFNKSIEANWKVTWHQDRVIAVKERKDVPGWGPWSVKEGVVHVSPPPQVMANMLAVRIHLDDCGEDNGPLRILPGTHKVGYFSDNQIQRLEKSSAIACAANRGDVVLMSPLAVHASSAATKPRSRRVIHIEFAAEELPHGLKWFERVPARS